MRLASPEVILRLLVTLVSSENYPVDFSFGAGPHLKAQAVLLHLSLMS